MNKFIDGLKETNEFGYTENGAVKRTTTRSKLLDMFSQGAAKRNADESDIIHMFKEAYNEDPLYALKCLFYIRDILGGQGERRFFRICIHWLAKNDPEVVKRNLKNIPEYGRYDDLYALVDTPVEDDMWALMRHQLMLDLWSETPSLLAKWMKSENTSSAESRTLGNKTRRAMGLSHRQYRKALSILRERINIVERLMSENQWDKIQFDKIPSRAGMIYKNAFARRDIIKEKYREFASDPTTKVNAKTLYPYDCVVAARRDKYKDYIDPERLMTDKYWDNLTDYFNGASFNGMAIVDTSYSMCGYGNSVAPIDVAISLGLYCADKAAGPFHNYFMTFESNPHFVEVHGHDFVEKVANAMEADWGGSTNIQGAFDLMLNTAVKHHCSPDEIPENLIVISDMEFNMCTYSNGTGWGGSRIKYPTPDATLFERIKAEWAAHGYKMPKLIFWNVDARSNNIPMRDDGYVNYVSGFSPVLFEQIMKGLTAYDLMMDKLNSERYAAVK